MHHHTAPAPTRTVDELAVLLANDVALELLAVLLAPRPDWHLDAACREHPELTWYPGPGENADVAKTVCRSCLARPECLADALDTPASNDHGIRAATSARERARMRRDTAG